MSRIRDDRPHDTHARVKDSCQSSAKTNSLYISSASEKQHGVINMQCNIVHNLVTRQVSYQSRGRSYIIYDSTHEENSPKS